MPFIPKINFYQSEAESSLSLLPSALVSTLTGMKIKPPRVYRNNITSQKPVEEVMIVTTKERLILHYICICLTRHPNTIANIATMTIF